MRRLARLPATLGVLVALAGLTGLAAGVVAGMVAVAPVDATTSTVSWPRAGADPTPTTAFLVPYRPAQLRADIPCASLREAARRRDATTVLATTTSDASRGLVVRADRGTTRLLVDGRSRVLDLPPGDCSTRVDVDASGMRVSVGGRLTEFRREQPVPEVFAITTDLTGAPARGLSLTARTPSWFDVVPSPEKSSLITVALQLAAVTLGLLVALGGLDRPAGRYHRPRTVDEAVERLGRLALAASVAGWVRGVRTARRVVRWAAHPRTWALAGIDVGVVVGLVWWSVVGPMTDDDGFAAAIARRAAAGGPVSNYYRWFDASEAPFASGQQVLGLLVGPGVDPLALRTPSVLAGIAVWFLVTRGVLRRGLGGGAGMSVAVRLATAVLAAAWWLPYGLGTRPEPLVALGVTAVLTIVLRAVRPESRHAAVLVASAVAIAAVTVTVAPSGLIGLAPIVLAAPRLARALRGHRSGLAGLGWAVATASAVAGVASVAVVVVFARQSWHGVMVATSIHQQFGPSQPWYAEWLRYSYLFGDDSWGSATKRLPVLLAVALAVPGFVLLARRGRAALGVPSAQATVLLGLAPLGLALLAVTPSKWSHHFGSLAGFGAVSGVAVLVALVREAGRPRPDPVLRVIGPGTVLGVVVAAAASFAGPNAWWAYSSAYLPWATGPVVPVAGPGRWLVAAAVLAVVAVPAAWLGRRSRGIGAQGAVGTREALTGAAALTPALLGPLAALASVTVLVFSFAAAADPPPGAWSLGARNLAVARDPGSPASCGLADRVQVLTTAARGPLTTVPGPDGTATLDGFVEQGGWVDAPPARPGDTDGTRDGRFAWGSKGGGEASVGGLTSGWFVLPRPGREQELALSVAGRTSDGASVTLEYGRSGRRGITTIVRRPVVEPPAAQRGYRGYAPDAERARLQDESRDRSGWRTVTVPAGDLPPDADRVRVLARDDRADVGGWVAATGPRLVDVVPLRRYLATRTPVVVDWAIAFAWPCLTDLAPVARGVAATPRALITTPPAVADPLRGERTVDDARPDDVVPERWTLGTDALVTARDSAASFAGMREAADLEEVDTRLAGEPGRVWGRLMIPDYRSLERDAYDVRATTTRVAGTEGDPAPSRDPRPPGGGP